MAESRTLANVLRLSNKPLRYIEFDGRHEIPPEAIQALVTFISP